MSKKVWFFIGSAIFLLWGIANTWFSISRYGIGQGMYMWFCNFALFAIAYGLFRRDASWIISFLAISLFTQSFWVIDNIWRIITKKNLFGLVEFMYQPGYPLDEFLVSHYHYFIIPAAILGIVFLKQKIYNAARITFIFGIFIFSTSYFLFPSEQNLNCVKESCFVFLKNWKGAAYSLIFSIIVTLMCTIGAYFIERLHKRIEISQKQKNPVIYVFCIVVFLGIILTIIDINYKKTLPTFACSGPFEDSGIKISCKYSTEFDDQKMGFVYEIENKLPEPKVCTSSININGIKELMHKDLYIYPNKKYSIAYILPYPKEDSIGKLSVSCD